MKRIAAELITLADKLDQKGAYAEADQLTKIVADLSEEKYFEVVDLSKRDAAAEKAAIAAGWESLEAMAKELGISFESELFFLAESEEEFSIPAPSDEKEVDFLFIMSDPGAVEAGIENCSRAFVEKRKIVGKDDKWFCTCNSALEF